MGWVFMVIPLLICCLEKKMYWLLNLVYCAQVTCAGWVYLYLGGRVKNFMFQQNWKKNTLLFSWGFPMTYQIKGGKWVILYSDFTVD